MGQIEILQFYKLENNENLFQVLGNPKDQIFFNREIMDVLSEFCTLAANGELDDVLSNKIAPMFKTLASFH